MTRSRYWMGTCWDLSELDSLEPQWLLIGGCERTESEIDHWHVIAYFKNARRSLRTGTTHWEVVKDITAAIKYATKEGVTEERGIRPINTRDPDQWKGFVEACKEQTPNELIDGPYSKTYARYTRFAHDVRSRFRENKVIDGELINEWYWGAPGTGKTRKAWQENPGMYIKSINKWWDGYDNEEVVLLDDWDPTHKVLVSHLKLWADRYPFRAELKGSSMVIRPKKIIVTSNYPPEFCFDNDEDVSAIKRRFKIIHFDGL